SGPEEGAGGVRDRLGGLFAKAANRASEGADRLREAAGAGLRPSILQHAQAARERGNLEAAFWLLDEAFREGPEDRETILAFWDVALRLERGPTAAAAGIALVETSASEGRPDLAARYFVELTGAVADAWVSPAAVARMLPPLCARIAAAAPPEAEAARELARLALRHALHEAQDGSKALTPGLAVHLFKEAREIDREAACRTAKIALSSPDLHEVKRAELERYLAEQGAARECAAGPSQHEPEVDPGDAPPELEVDAHDASPELEVDPEASDPAVASATPEPAASEPDGDEGFEIAHDPALEDAFEAAADEAYRASGVDDEPVLPPLSQEEVQDAARRLVDRHGPLSTEGPPPVPDGLRVIRAVPVDFEEQALLLRLPGGRPSRVGWKEIEALAVAELSHEGAQPQVVVDCILNWRRRDREPLRLVRLFTCDFEPRDFVDSDDADLSAFLTELFERCQAAPLPDPESALGVRVAVYDDIDCYQREVLRV
ncbi:MAG: hypothetical protein ACR2P8_15675, partial [Myxococcota bacterium]